MKSNSLLKDVATLYSIELLDQKTRWDASMTNDLKHIDIAKSTLLNAQKLDRVGMRNIECPVLIELPGTPVQMTAGRADAFVSLDEPQKGIHMSRLFLHLTDAISNNAISPSLLAKVVQDFLKSHDGMSQSSEVRVHFELMLKRPALLSSNMGWRAYPLTLWSKNINGQLYHGLEVTIRYSSTCPCSAALARQLIQNKFMETYPVEQQISRSDVLHWLGLESSIAGTPHGQRSEGKVRLHFVTTPSDLSFIVSIIDSLEIALATPVQSAVKREDEQEFARLNASNLMFAEDAVRRMSAAVSNHKMFSGTACEVYHLESLHPHDAVAKVATGDLKNTAWA